MHMPVSVQDYILYLQIPGFTHIPLTLLKKMPGTTNFVGCLDRIYHLFKKLKLVNLVG